MKEQLSEIDQAEFNAWCDRLDEHAKTQDGPEEGYTRMTGRECWINFFEDGYTPEEAWAEELSCA